MNISFFITDKSHNNHILGPPPLDHLLSDLVYPGEVAADPAVETRELSPPTAVARGHNTHRCPGESGEVLVQESSSTVSLAGISASLGMSGTQETITSERKFKLEFY